MFLRENPLCALCAGQGRTTLANVVDHRIPHKGDPELFWDQTNWQSLCTPCHDTSKKILEHRGYLPGVDVNGDPIDPGHHWKK